MPSDSSSCGLSSMAILATAKKSIIHSSTFAKAESLALVASCDYPTSLKYKVRAFSKSVIAAMLASISVEVILSLVSLV